MEKNGEIYEDEDEDEDEDEALGFKFFFQYLKLLPVVVVGDGGESFFGQVITVSVA